MSPRQCIRLRPGIVFDFNDPSHQENDVKSPHRTPRQVQIDPAVGDTMLKNGRTYGPIHSRIGDQLYFGPNNDCVDLDFWDAGDYWEAAPNPKGRLPVGNPTDLMKRSDDYIVWMNRGSEPFNAQKVETFRAHNIPSWVFVFVD